MDKKLLTIQDISCFGQCSLTVALPVISACGIETVILPSAVLSTHTAGFKNYPFQRQQFYFPFDPAPVSGQVPVCTDDPVAWDDDGDRIVSDRSAYRLCGHFRKSVPTGDFLRDFTVSHGLTVRDSQHDLPHFPPERTGPHVQRRGEIRFLSAEINIQPADRFPEDRQFLLRFRVVFRAIEPQFGQCRAVAHQRKRADRGIIAPDEVHRIYSVQ